jgi:hypothetical protein
MVCRDGRKFHISWQIFKNVPFKFFLKTISLGSQKSNKTLSAKCLLMAAWWQRQGHCLQYKKERISILLSNNLSHAYLVPRATAGPYQTIIKSIRLTRLRAPSGLDRQANSIQKCTDELCRSKGVWGSHRNRGSDPSTRSRGTQRGPPLLKPQLC